VEQISGEAQFACEISNAKYDADASGRMIIFSILISRHSRTGVLLTVVTLFYALPTCLIEITFMLNMQYARRHINAASAGVREDPSIV
jgi:hypothetical protein